MSHVYIISGAPGTGKTSLLQALAAKGYPTYPEIARQIISEQLLIKGDIVPWLKLEEFSAEILRRMELLKPELLQHDKFVFVDRGIPDIMAYLHNSHKRWGEEYVLALKNYPYSPKVFLLPPWPEIYANDNERRETFREASAIHKHMLEVYTQLGFSVIVLPRSTVNERVEIILSQFPSE